MEEKSPHASAKRLCAHIAKVVLYLLRKSFSKQKFMVDLHDMMKKGKHAGKAIGNLMSNHYSDLSCRSGGVSVVPYAPGEYEYSCSNTPAYTFPFRSNKRKPHYGYHHGRRRRHHQNDYLSCTYPQSSNDEHVAADFQKALEQLTSGRESWSSTAYALSPMASPYPLRVTDSPFPLKNEDDDDHRVDKEAEEFIARFHEQLRSQRRTAMLEARYHDVLMYGSG
ncbi:hypothetical protein EJ110_NYTH30467 [Nymphaea thermarum]|nr:hypothetical protein EJ110_NYTH30467 [Nymphaea thermarum]